MLWKEQWWGTIVGSSRHHIDVEVTLDGGSPWRLT